MASATQRILVIIFVVIFLVELTAFCSNPTITCKYNRGHATITKVSTINDCSMEHTQWETYCHGISSGSHFCCCFSTTPIISDWSGISDKSFAATLNDLHVNFARGTDNSDFIKRAITGSSRNSKATPTQLMVTNNKSLVVSQALNSSELNKTATRSDIDKSKIKHKSPVLTVWQLVKCITFHMCSFNSEVTDYIRKCSVYSLYKMTLQWLNRHRADCTFPTLTMNIKDIRSIMIPVVSVLLLSGFAKHKRFSLQNNKPIKVKIIVSRNRSQCLVIDKWKMYDVSKCHQYDSFTNFKPTNISWKSVFRDVVMHPWTATSEFSRTNMVVYPVTRFLPDPTRDPAIDLAHVGYRLATLSALPAAVPVSRIRLADAGFYFLGHGDEVTCYKCGARHSGWRRGDNPLQTHRQLSPHCPHMADYDAEQAAIASFSAASVGGGDSEDRTSNSAQNATGGGNTGTEARTSGSGQSSNAGGGSGNNSEVRNSHDTRPSADSNRVSDPTHQTNLAPQQPVRSTSMAEDGGDGRSVSAQLAPSPSVSTTVSRTQTAHVTAGTSSRHNTPTGTASGTVGGSGSRPTPVVGDSGGIRSDGNSGGSAAPQAGQTARVTSNCSSSTASRPSASTSGFRSDGQNSGNATAQSGQTASVTSSSSASTASRPSASTSGYRSDGQNSGNATAQTGQTARVINSSSASTATPSATSSTESRSSASSVPAEDRTNGSSRPGGGAEARPLFPRAGLDLGGAVYPMYQDMQSRRRTFTRWDDTSAPPLDHVVLSGMFYAGYADCVRCFYCGVGLKHWVAGDDVWTEHVRWRPGCEYLRAIKGDDFIRDTQRRLALQGTRLPQSSQNPPATQSQQTANSSTPTTTTSPSVTATTTSSAVRTAAASTTTRSTTGATPSVTATTGATPSVTATTGATPSVTVTTASAGAQPSVAVTTTSRATANSSSSVDAVPGGAGRGRGAGSADQQHLARLQAENQELTQRFRCRVCRNAAINTILMPCGHLVVCENCARSVTSCPLCNDAIRATARVHMA